MATKIDQWYSDLAPTKNCPSFSYSLYPNTSVGSAGSCVTSDVPYVTGDRHSHGHNIWNIFQAIPGPFEIPSFINLTKLQNIFNFHHLTLPAFISSLFPTKKTSRFTRSPPSSHLDLGAFPAALQGSAALGLAEPPHRAAAVAAPRGLRGRDGVPPAAAGAEVAPLQHAEAAEVRGRRTGRTGWNGTRWGMLRGMMSWIFDYLTWTFGNSVNFL
jgi:hypothetical protein